MQRLPELQATSALLTLTSSASPTNSDTKCHSPIRCEGRGKKAWFILQILPDNWVPTSSAVKKSSSFSQPVLYHLFNIPLSHCLPISLKLRSKVFSLVNYTYILRFPITLHISLVYDQLLQKAHTYISLLAKKLGQPFTEIHADSTSANKQKKAVMVWGGICLVHLDSSTFIRTRRICRSFTEFL